ILGGRGEHALAAACKLGVAMQLTNIVRDVGEDLQRGRVYLPREELGRAGVSSEMLRSRAVTPELRTVLRGIAEEAREQYAHGTGDCSGASRRCDGLAWWQTQPRYMLPVSGTMTTPWMSTL